MRHQVSMLEVINHEQVKFRTAGEWCPLSIWYVYNHNNYSAILIASTSAAAPRLRLLQLLPPKLRPLQLPFPDCVRFSCCSPTASVSAAQLSSGRFQPLHEHSQSSRNEGRVHCSVVQPPVHPTSITHTHTWLNS